jgi:hypothetical protein
MSKSTTNFIQIQNQYQFIHEWKFFSKTKNWFFIWWRNEKNVCKIKNVRAEKNVYEKKNVYKKKRICEFKYIDI